jgi:hypothetical protein
MHIFLRSLVSVFLCNSPLPMVGSGVVKLKTPTDYTGRQISFALSMTLLFLDMRSLNYKKGRRLAVIKVKLAKKGGGEGIALILL